MTLITLSIILNPWAMKSVIRASNSNWTIPAEEDHCRERLWFWKLTSKNQNIAESSVYTMEPNLREVQSPRMIKGVPFQNVCSGLRYFLFLDSKKWALHSRKTYESDGCYYPLHQPLGAGRDLSWQILIWRVCR